MKWRLGLHIDHRLPRRHVKSTLEFFYHPQTKFAKVMFSQVSVCPRGRGTQAQGGGGVQAQAWEGLPRGVGLGPDPGVCPGPGPEGVVYPSMH